MSYINKLNILARAVFRHPLKPSKQKTYYRRGLSPSLYFNAISNAIIHNPLISVLIVSFNSVEDLPECLASLQKQSYSRFELIVVENGEADTETIVRSFFPDARYIKSPKNLGFAEGNNLANQYAKGEYIALINPDTRLDVDCLAELLSTYRFDSTIGAVVPKLRFWTRFVDIDFSSSFPFEIDLVHLESQLHYRKVFTRFGQLTDDRSKLAAKISSATDAKIEYAIALRLPIDNSSPEIRILSTYPSLISCCYSGRPLPFELSDTSARLTLLLDQKNFPSAQWVINNAGSGIRDDYPYDIGFSEFDSVEYDREKGVDAFCGCVALIRRLALIGQPLFKPEFFAYFEDSETSARLVNQGWKITYRPRAIAYHKHSTTSSEGSPLWKLLVNRSRLIYDAATKFNYNSKALSAFLLNDRRYIAAPEALKETLFEFDKLIGRPAKQRRTIGLYNSWWNTFGGGELHALAVLRELASDQDEIFLLSETDFDVDALMQRFNMHLPQYIKIIVPSMTPEVTSKFDIFINSTYGSGLVSKAKRSFYLVSFPHIGMSGEAKSAYEFLFNSNFTQDWAKKIWGSVRGSVVYPTLSMDLDVGQIPPKSRSLISIGRITASGHAKNQDEIIAAFLRLQADSEFRDWTLNIVGNIDHNNSDDAAYLERLKKMASSNGNIRILPNLPKSEMDELLLQASVYVHATGLNQPKSAPEKHEHFGISVLEACMSGCYPIAYSVGGPAELIAHLGFGSTYRSSDELVTVLAERMRQGDATEASEIIAAARIFCTQNKAYVRQAFVDLSHNDA